MNPQELLRAGRLDEAIDSLGAELRAEPGDARRRIFLFELLCFAGRVPAGGKAARYPRPAWSRRGHGHAALPQRAPCRAGSAGNVSRGQAPHGACPRPVSGKLNGTPFQSLTDADPRIGARLEVYAAGQYTWIPLEQIASVRIPAPSRLRDLLWAPAAVRTGVDFRGVELGEVLLPVLAPLTWQDSNDAVRLGRMTEWRDLGDGAEAPIGQKLLLVDGEEFPMLELRELDIVPATVAVS